MRKVYTRYTYKIIYTQHTHTRKDQEKMGRIRINISIEEETKERLERYAEQHHTNISRAIEQWIWNEEIKPKKKTTTRTNNNYLKCFLQYDEYIKRYTIVDTKNNIINSGLHCGDGVEVKVGNRYKLTRIEMSSDGDYYLVDTDLRGKDLERLQVRIEKK